MYQRMPLFTRHTSMKQYSVTATVNKWQKLSNRNPSTFAIGFWNCKIESLGCCRISTIWSTLFCVLVIAVTFGWPTLRRFIDPQVRMQLPFPRSLDFVNSGGFRVGYWWSRSQNVNGCRIWRCIQGNIIDRNGSWRLIIGRFGCHSHRFVHERHHYGYVRLWLWMNTCPYSIKEYFPGSVTRWSWCLRRYVVIFQSMPLHNHITNVRGALRTIQCNMAHDRLSGCGLCQTTDRIGKVSSKTWATPTMLTAKTSTTNGSIFEPPDPIGLGQVTNIHLCHGGQLCIRY